MNGPPDSRRPASEASWLTPLADLGFLAALVATPPLAIWAGIALPGWYGAGAGAGGVAIIALFGRARLGAIPTLGVASATWVAGAVGLYAWLDVLVSTSTCGKTISGGWEAVALVGGALVYLTVGSYGFRTGRALIALPMALLLGMAMTAVLSALVPGTPGVCEW